MKRQFVRRGLYTPFQKHILAKIQPNHPDELKKTALREAEEAAAAAAIRAENGNVEEEAQMKMDVDAPVKDEEQPVAPVASTSLTKVEVVDPPPAASTSALPLVASTSNDITMNDDTNDVLATLGVQDAYESDGEDPDTTGMDVDDLKWDLKDVPWHRITLDVKVRLSRTILVPLPLFFPRVARVSLPLPFWFYTHHSTAHYRLTQFIKYVNGI